VRDAGGRTVLTTVTAWGADADHAGQPGDELLVQAASGLMTASTDGDGTPLRFPGWQSQYLAGAYAAAASLAALAGGGFHHVEVTWVGAMLSGAEAGLSAYLQRASATGASAGRDDARGDRQAGIQAQAFPAGAFRCADGHVVPGTVRPVDWELQCAVYDRRDLLDDERFSWVGRWENREQLVAELRPWYDAHTKREIFLAALDADWAAAMVMTAADAMEDPHLAERRFLTTVHGAASAVVPGRPWRAPSIPEGVPTTLAAPGADAGWLEGETVDGHRRSGPPAPPPLAELRVISLTWAWAGPFVGRFLGALGADVVRVETGSRPDAWRTRLRWREAGVPVPSGADPDGYTWDAAALFNTLNRSTRSVSVDLSHPDGRAVFLELLDAADGLVVNMGAGMLAARGIEDAVRKATNHRLVAVAMPALGDTGPYRAMNGYGTLMEGMGGFAARYGPADDGARVSATYYPDAVAGVHGAVALVAGLAERSRTGRGSFIDLSQQETTWLQLGEGIVLRSMEGREPGRIGNAEPGCDPSGIVGTEDGGWEAVVGERSEPVRTWDQLLATGELERRGLVEWLDHPVTGRRAYMALPVAVDGRRLVSTRPAPVFDEHTDAVLAEWAGITGHRLDALRASGAVGSVPAARPRPKPEPAV